MDIDVILQGNDVNTPYELNMHTCSASVVFMLELPTLVLLAERKKVVLLIGMEQRRKTVIQQALSRESFCWYILSFSCQTPTCQHFRIYVTL